MEIKFKSQASIALEQLFVALKEMTVHLHRALETLTRLGRSDSAKPRRLQALRKKRMICESFRWKPLTMQSL